MQYEKLVYKLGSLYGMLRELEQEGLFQGEQTILYADQKGHQRTLRVYIDGTDLQMSETPSDPRLGFSLDAFIDDE